MLPLIRLLSPLWRSARPAALAVACALATTPGVLVGQSITVVPEALSRVPSAQLGDGTYWQQLRIELAHADRPAQQSIRIELPTGIAIDDLDGDGAAFDQVRVVYRAVDAELPRFRASSATTDSLIVLTNQERAGIGGELYVQFPIRITAPASATTAPYRSVVFADTLETDLSGDQLPVLSFIDPVAFAEQGSMGLAEFAASLSPASGDTTTSARGSLFPSTAQSLVTSLPDLIFDAGLGTPNIRPGHGDGDDANDAEYRFFFSSSPNLTAVNDEVAVAALRADSTVYTEHEGGPGQSLRLLTQDLAADIYWLYVTSDITGQVPLGRSRALRVRHQPIIDRLGPSGSDPVVFDTGGLFDSRGEANGQGARRFILDLSVVDHDDEATVHLFYSGNPNLGEGEVEIQGETVILHGAQAITILSGLPEALERFAWDTAGPPLIAEGDYYIYAVAVGGGEFTAARTGPQILVRHAPFLRLDAFDDDGEETVVTTGGTQPQRFLTLTWGRAGTGGDGDVDGDALIDLFYSSRTDFDLPDGADAIIAAADDSTGDTHRMTVGLTEDPDSRADNQFIWDLWSLHGTAAVPDSGVSYRLYGLISDGDQRRLEQIHGGRPNDGGARLRFSHPPTIRPLQPVSDLTIDGGHTARVSWEDLDLDDDARIRVVLSAEDHGEVAAYDVVTAGLAFVVNSENGRAQPEVDALHDIREDADADYLDVGTGHLQVSLNGDSPPDAGTYHVYIAIEEGDRFDGETRTWRTPGGLRIPDPRTPTEATAFRLFPEAFTIGTGGLNVQTMEIALDAAGDTVDLAQVSLRLDASRFAVVDQDAEVEGLQPFVVAAGYSDAKLVRNEAITEDGSLLLSFEYFDPGPVGIPGLDGSRSVALFELTALAGEGDDEVAIELLDDVDDGRRSSLELDGAEVHAGATAPVAVALLVPGRSTVAGRIVLEGRIDRAAVVDVTLRRLGEFADFTDDLFASTNDEDPLLPGVQITLDESGDFVLQEVPSGRYDLHLRRPGYLEGRAAGLELYPGALVADVRPTTTGAAGDSLLLGGDVAGYTDTSGASVPDNEITLADWDYMASLFDQQLAVDSDSAHADISGDGAVNIRDLSLVGANFRRRGPSPVYRRARSTSTLTLWLDMPARFERGDTVLVVLRAGASGRVHALEVDLRTDAGGWRVLDGRGPTRALATHLTRPWGDRMAVVSAGGVGLRTDQPLASWRLLALTDSPPAPSLARVQALDAGHQPLATSWSPAAEVSAPLQLLPERFALRPNYPNPFNPATVIEFEVPSGVDGVRLEVYDILGQRVRVLVDGSVAAGVHRIRWDGRDTVGRAVASGAYFARLSAPGSRHVRPMLLLR